MIDRLRDECDHISAERISDEDLNEIRDFVECARKVSRKNQGEEVHVAQLKKTGPKYGGGRPDERGTTGLTVRYDAQDIVLKNGEFVERDIDKIDSDPALGPRTEIRDERDIDFASAVAKSIEASMRRRDHLY